MVDISPSLLGATFENRFREVGKRKVVTNLCAGANRDRGSRLGLGSPVTTTNAEAGLCDYESDLAPQIVHFGAVAPQSPFARNAGMQHGLPPFEARRLARFRTV